MALSLRKISLTIVVLLFVFFSGFSQKFGFDKILKDSPEDPFPFCIPNNTQNQSVLKKENIHVKFGNENWIFITATAQWMDQKIRNKEITDFYFETAPPTLLSDTARLHHFVDPVHNGTDGLQVPFTGENVIIGVVDTGLDFNHPDFLDENGDTRILRYWDHTISAGSNSPYGYGYVWDSTQINAGLCTSVDNSAHGTTVTGIAAGNGRANGQNLGMAPNAKLVIVESNFSLPNWTLSIADACDYIFRVADTMGLPAVVNLSLGSYFGSHDGNDAAANFIESLLDAKPGRIVVSAAGNSGAKGKYHQQGNPTPVDTNFVWFLNNASGAYGANTIFFDLYSDAADATWEFALGADKPGPNYGFRGRTNFHGAQSSLGVVIRDTIWNGSNRIATVEVYTGLEGSNYHMQMFVSKVDSTSYLFRFETKGSGKYDLWSGQWLGFNNMVTAIPTPVQMPGIVKYVMPDTLQTIVSSWNCSEKVISVANFRNRATHMTKSGPYLPSDMTPVGKLSPNSSKGPNRHNVIKPDVAGAGDVTLAAGPLWFLSNPGNNGSIDTNNWHMRNGGTSMASPIIAGIAALYLEKCHKANYQDFKNDLLSTSYSDANTGVLPNNSFGYGKAHARDLLVSRNYNTNLSGVTQLCSDPEILTINSANMIDSVFWSDGMLTVSNIVSVAGDYHAVVYDNDGCVSYTDTLTMVQLIVPTIDPIVQDTDTLSTNASDDYQWTLNGSDLAGENNPTLTISAPYGTYTCYTTSVDGCVAETQAVIIGVGLNELFKENTILYPNPAVETFKINSNYNVITVYLVDLTGKKIQLSPSLNDEYSLKSFASGNYIIVIETDKGIFSTNLNRM